MIQSIDFQQTLRYLGNSNLLLNANMEALLKECESEILRVIEPRFLYKIFPKDPVLLKGEDIKTHLKDCEKVVILCATIGREVDRLIRKAQIEDMAKAVVLDAMGSTAIEQLCDSVEEGLKKEIKDYNFTWRFSPGYGDYPIELQKEFLRILDGERKIGLCTNESFLLTPLKSVTAIIGLSKKAVNKSNKGCSNCNLAKTCKFREAGKSCEL